MPATWTAPASRHTDKELEDLARETDATPRGRFGGRAGAPGRQGGPAAAGRGGAQSFAQRLAQFLKDEGVVATVTTGARGDGGTLFVQGAAANRQPNADAGLPAVVIAVEHYGRIVRALQKNMPVEDRPGDPEHVPGGRHGVVQRNRRDPGHRQGRRGRDAGRALRLVARATGATDNAAGSAVMMEAMRILKQSGLKLRRTVRIALWGGEEQGLIGSREYVTAHFANAADMVLKPAHAKFAGYFNVDNGTGAIRGVYLQGNEAVAPIFEAWMKPFNNIGMSTLTIRDTGGTDHQSFDASDYRASSSSRTTWSTTRARITRTWTLRADPGRGHAQERRDRRRLRLRHGEPRGAAAAQAAARARGWTR